MNASVTCSVTSVMTPSAPTPTRAAANTSGFSVAEQVEHLAGAGHDGQPDDERGQAAELRAGAVGAGGQRAGHGLHVDVAEVRHGETVGGQHRLSAWSFIPA